MGPLAQGFCSELWALRAFVPWIGVFASQFQQYNTILSQKLQVQYSAVTVSVPHCMKCNRKHRIVLMWSHLIKNSQNKKRSTPTPVILSLLRRSTTENAILSSKVI